MKTRWATFVAALLIASALPAGAAAAADRTDPGFGEGGVAVIAPPAGVPGGQGSITALAPTSGSGMLAAVSGGRGAGYFGIARFDAGGRLDPAYGEDGFGAPVRVAHPGPAGDGLATYAEGLATTPGGEAVVAGLQANSVRGTAPLLALYRADGSLDPTFGGGGVVAPKPATEATSETHLYEGGGTLHDVGVESSGRIVAVGAQNENAGGRPAAMVIAYRPDGFVDHGFGKNGRVLFTASGRALETAFTTMRVLGNDSILVAGYLRGHLTLLKLDAKGRLDHRFGDEGMASVPIPRFGFCCQGRALLRPLAGGKILIGSEASRHGEGPLALVRLLPDGKVDRSFGEDGKAVGTPSGGKEPAVQPEALAVQGNGRIVVTGYRESVKPDGKATPVFASVRYLVNGKLDRGFGDRGIQLLGSAGGTAGQAALSGPDGRVVAAGGALAGGAFQKSSLLLTRYLPN